MRYSYKPSGVCAMQINFDIDGDVISNVEFIGGCNGNLKAVSKLVDGCTVDYSKASCSEIPADSSQPPVLTSYARQYVRHTKRQISQYCLRGKGRGRHGSLLVHRKFRRNYL